jgi:hypothetical protein
MVNEPIALPYAATLSWYADYVKWLIGEGDYPAPSPRQLNRCSIKSNAGIRYLTLPVEGGFSILKNGRHTDAALSAHGDWRREHKGALAAEYGKMPYYAHFAPLLFDVMDRDDLSLQQMNKALHEAICKAAGLEQLSALQKMREERPNTYKEIHQEVSAKLNTDVSILEAIFMVGRDTTFYLLEPLKGY